MTEAQAVPCLHVTVLEGPDRGVELTSSETLSVGSADGNDLTLHDDAVSRFHVELARQDSGVLVVDQGSSNGTWLGETRLERATVPPSSQITIGETRLRLGSGNKTVVELHGDVRFGGLVGRSAVMRRLMAKLKKASGSEIPVLLIGESGTGKEVIARALHEQSGRREGPFVTVDCGALTPGLVTSELFGHERGAFTSAERQQTGAFERAHGGTLFLDEIGELPAELQAHLLGVLERRTFRRVGGEEEIAADVRVVAATNRDLRADVNSGKFRLDLYYRLAVSCLQVPPLQDRTEDVPLLAEHVVRQLGYDGPLDVVVPPDAMERMKSYRWPGNVRELRNMMEARLAIGETIRPGAMNAPNPGAAQAAPNFEAFRELPYKQARAQLLHQFESEYLPGLLERAEGNVAMAARFAGMDRSHLFTLLRKHGLR